MRATTVHASAVRVGDRGVLIRGSSGSGKSSLVLALLFGADDTVLIADDQVSLSCHGGRLMAAAPASLAGLLEVRGVGIVTRPYVSPASIDLVVDLKPLADCPRLPGEGEAMVDIAGAAVRRVFVAAGAADGAHRVRAALASVPL